MNQSFLTLPSLEKASLAGRRVLVRLDLDLPLDYHGHGGDLFRLKTALPTLKKCLSEAAGVVLIGHRGRPQGRDTKLSLKPTAEELGRLLNHPIIFVENFVKLRGVKSEKSGEKLLNLVMLENLRFWPGETGADPEFVNKLAVLGDLFVNESFASAHRQSASATSLPRRLPTVFGYRFLQEVAAVERVFHSPARPVVVVLGGAKADKLDYLPGLLKIADQVLLGGALPRLNQLTNPRLVTAELGSDGLDISPASRDQFAKLISEAGTVIWNGPMGKFEDGSHMAGTEAVAKAVAAASGFTLVGGGDTQAALAKLKLTDKIKHLSTGGGALMEFLSLGTLAAIEAVRPRESSRAVSIMTSDER